MHMLGTGAHSITVGAFEREYGLAVGSGLDVLAQLGVPIMQLADEPPKILLVALEWALVQRYTPPELHEGLPFSEFMDICSRCYSDVATAGVLTHLRRVALKLRQIAQRTGFEQGPMPIPLDPAVKPAKSAARS